ncbi:MAG: hypothetical protein JO293_05135 [Candidatus Eremiobacteraeota bacterium]|nr:hypothetical protein [Candidatus Eremiobacteraeota bacterium]MBV8222722.1 hypothetical protein [Candidatus Eremiobacteraeota bacterium]MBV8282277.1 hypothetical protein [Candidatus Eremiobacteraeota bacterium]
MRYVYAILITALLGLGFAPAIADTTYIDTSCGTWVNDEWVPNGNCPPETDHLRHTQVAGTITSVKGHLVTLQQTDRAVVINDQPALERQQTGKVAVGRMVVAYGYWMDGTFYATSIY